MNVSREANPAPRHRASHRAEKPKRTSLRYSAVAAATTGVVVTGGVAATSLTGTAAAADFFQPRTLTADDLAERTQAVSRSSDDLRTDTDQAKVDMLASTAGAATTGREKINGSNADPRILARALMPEYGLKVSEFSCLDRIWTQESNWNVHADNPHSSAYGIPQALPGSKMSSAGPNWQNSAETQIRWGLGYIRDRYGSACAAWGFKSGHGWY